MKANLSQIILGGIAATAVMTVVAYMAPLMGLPKMDAAAMLSEMLNIPLALTWVMHFMIGVFFAAVYGRLFIEWLRKVNSRALRGMIYGFIVFVFAQVMLMIMAMVMPTMPDMGGNMLLMMTGSLVGHLIYGLVLGVMVTGKKVSLSVA